MARQALSSAMCSLVSGSARACVGGPCLRGESETHQQVMQKESHRTHSRPVLERKSTRRSKDIHLSDNAITRRGRCSTCDPLFVITKTLETGDEGRFS